MHHQQIVSGTKELCGVESGPDCCYTDAPFKGIRIKKKVPSSGGPCAGFDVDPRLELRAGDGQTPRRCV